MPNPIFTTLETTSLPAGKSLLVIEDSPSAAGSQAIQFALKSDSVLISLFVTSTTGTLDVEVYTFASSDYTKRRLVSSFPGITSPTTDLLVRQPSICMGNIEVVVTYSDACSFEIRARGITVGASSTKILGSTGFKASQTNIPTTPTIVIAASLEDRDGLILKNNNNSEILYIAESAVAANTATAYPLANGESLGIDIAAGVEIWGIASAGTIDVRILESGG